VEFRLLNVGGFPLKSSEYQIMSNPPRLMSDCSATVPVLRAESVSSDPDALLYG